MLTETWPGKKASAITGKKTETMTPRKTGKAFTRIPPVNETIQQGGGENLFLST